MDRIFLRPAEVADSYPLLSVARLAEMRWRGEGPPYIKTGSARSSRVFYRASDIEEWLAAHTVVPEAA